MKTKLFFIFLVIIYPRLLTYAQADDPQKRLANNSLEAALLAAQSDTAKISLRYAVGNRDNQSRATFWDSLVSDAHRCEMFCVEAGSLYKLGHCQYVQGQIKASIESYNKSLKIAEGNGCKQELFGPLLNLAGTYFMQNNIKDGLSYCFRSLKVAEELKDNKKIAIAYSLLGSIYFRAKEPTKALKVHMQCKEISERYNLHEEMAWALLDIGSDYRELGATSNTIKYYLMTRPYLKEFGDGAISAQIYNSLGSAYELQGMHDSATYYCRKAYTIVERMNNKVGMASVLAQLARNSFGSGDYYTAKQEALKAFELAEAVNFKGQIPALALLLKDVYVKEKNFKEAMKFYEIFVTITDSVTSEQTHMETLEKQMDYDLEKKENANKLLAQQNQIQNLQLKKNSYLITGMGAILLLAIIISYLAIRQSQLSGQQQRMQLEQKLLRSQMNPHFIFNSLQAIQNYILNHDAKDAVKYLSSFAGLTRSVLENSRMEYIPLKKELTLLENYLQLQKLRFGNRFDYEIKVDKKIDVDGITIPPMLAQPFIENAIKHGMHDIETGGKIEVSYSLINNMLLMEVMDNGYGMKQTGAGSTEHQSLAMEITRERIALINKKARAKIRFEISDAYPNEYEKNGVKISVSLPLQPPGENAKAKIKPLGNNFQNIKFVQEKSGNA